MSAVNRMWGAGALGFGTVLATYTSNESIGEDSRCIALIVTVALAALVACSPLMNTLEGLWYGPGSLGKPKGLKISTDAGTQGAGKDQEHSQTTGAVPAASNGATPSANGTAAAAAQAGAAVQTETQAVAPLTTRQFAKKNKHQLAGLAILMVAMSTGFGVVGPSGVLTLACFVAGMRFLVVSF